MATKLNSHLWVSRHGIYYIRIERNGKEHRQSLRTRDPEAAQVAAYRFGAAIMNDFPIRKWTAKVNGVEISTDNDTQEEHERTLEALKIIVAGQQQSAPVPTTPNTTPSAPVQQWTLNQTLQDYKEEVGYGKKESTWITYQSAFNKFLAEFGGTTPIHLITAEQVTKWRIKVMDGKQSPETTDKDLRALRGLFKWSIKRNRYTLQNPIEQPEITAAQRADMVLRFERKREAFTAGDLAKIIPAIIASERPCGFWIPLLVFLTGARPGEIAEATLNDIKETNDGTLSLLITKAKSPQSRRTIPLPPIIKEIGFLDYLDDVRRLPTKTGCLPIHIFPHLLPSPKNGRWQQPSKDFGALKKKLGFGEGKDCYSFRHTWISMSDRTGMNPNAARQYTGHITESKDAHTGYIQQFSFDELVEQVLPKIDFAKYPGYQLPAIKYTPGQFDQFFKDTEIKQKKRQRDKEMRLQLIKNQKQKEKDDAFFKMRTGRG